ncbi:hypothetical protein F0562_023620 [Nyssa sinensis]|uniref:Protein DETOXIFICATION n=1 Tax=Nyssa sinensis TaxID=561372 RepID=A0A5J5BHT7_9ASTE|nr:hypothetical protein F0562_023620 [Nyssa sinensis]
MDQQDSNPLLESPLIPSSEKDLGRGEKLSKNWCDIPETFAELRKQLKLAGPLMVVSFLQYSFQMISVMFVGHLGELSLSSASMATSFAGVTGFSFMCQLRFLQTQNNVKPLIISTGITSLIHVVVCWTLVFRVGFGNKGAALSNAISYGINVLILAIYIKFSSACRRTWTGFSKEGMKNLVSFLSLAIPSALMVCLEFWSYEFLVLMSGLLPNPKPETSMMSISLSTSCVVFRIPFGFGSAVSTRVSNELGAGQPRAARLAAQVVIFLAVTGRLLVSLISVAVRGIWGYLYTNEEEVVKFMASIMPVLATYNFIDGIQAVLSGPMDGNHKWEWSASIIAFSYYNAHRLGASIRTTVLTWITVLVLLAFVGKRRRVLVTEGRKITTDVAMYLVKVLLKERSLLAVAGATIVSLMAMAFA